MLPECRMGGEHGPYLPATRHPVEDGDSQAATSVPGKAVEAGRATGRLRPKVRKLSPPLGFGQSSRVNGHRCREDLQAGKCWKEFWAGRENRGHHGRKHATTEQHSSLTGTTGAESLRWAMGGDDVGKSRAPGSMAVTQDHACGLLLTTGEWLRPAHWNIQVWAGLLPQRL